MFRRAWVVAASSVLLIAGCQDAKKNQPVTAQKDEPQPYNATPSRSLDSMDNPNSTPPRNEPAYTQAPPPSNYDYNDANTAPSEKMTPTRGSSRPKSSAAKASSGGGTTYVVKKGDTLAKIAKKMYGDENKWKKIADANKSKVSDPKRLKVGTKLVIP